MPPTATDSSVLPELVELCVPADPSYVAVVRTAAASLAARLHITVDRLEDLRIAIDEVCALLTKGGEGSTLEWRFELDEERLRIEVLGPPTSLPDPGDYCWAVLAALVDHLDWSAPPAASTHGTRLQLAISRRPGAEP